MPGLVTESPIEAALTYSVLPEGGIKPYQWINEPTGGEPRTNVESVDFNYQIQDLRQMQDKFNLDTAGFELQSKPTAMTYDDWADEAKIRSVYYQEVENQFKSQLGAHRVTIFDHTVRRQPPKGTEVADTPSSRQPVSRVHVDQTPESARNRVRRHDAENAEKLLEGRVRLINVWRPLRGPVYDTPLAVADFRSLDTDRDFVPSDLIYSRSPEHIGETYQVNHNEGHRWYYASEMGPQEILLLKCYDSASEVKNPQKGIASLTPHTAFKDNRYFGKSDIEPRESIEIRALVYTD